MRGVDVVDSTVAETEHSTKTIDDHKRCVLNKQPILEPQSGAAQHTALILIKITFQILQW